MPEDAPKRRLGGAPRDTRRRAGDREPSRKFPAFATGHMCDMPDGVVFLTGASGFVGSRLLRALNAQGVHVRALSRNPAALDGRAELVQGDVRDTETVTEALRGASVAYYLVHSLGTGDFAAADRDAARSFALAAAASDLPRIVYLSGIGRGTLSPHLESRQEVGKILRRSKSTTIELRASIVIGDGSVSYDAFKALAKIPLALLPDWLDTRSQPIAIDDVVRYLLEAADLPTDESRIYEIGGRDVVPYRAILEALGGSAVIAPVPGIAATLATYLQPLEPERVRVVSDLLDSLRIDTSVQDDAALSAFSVEPMGLTDAIATAYR